MTEKKWEQKKKKEKWKRRSSKKEILSANTMDERIEPCFLGTLVHGSLQVPPAGDRGVLELLVTVIAVVLRERHGKKHRKNHIQKCMSVLSNQPFQLLQSSPAPSTEIMLQKKKTQRFVL